MKKGHREAGLDLLRALSEARRAGQREAVEILSDALSQHDADARRRLARRERAVSKLRRLAPGAFRL